MRYQHSRFNKDKNISLAHANAQGLFFCIFSFLLMNISASEGKTWISGGQITPGQASAESHFHSMHRDAFDLPWKVRM